MYMFAPVDSSPLSLVWFCFSQRQYDVCFCSCNALLFGIRVSVNRILAACCFRLASGISITSTKFISLSGVECELSRIGKLKCAAGHHQIQLEIWHRDYCRQSNWKTEKTETFCCLFEDDDGWIVRSPAIIPERSSWWRQEITIPWMKVKANFQTVTKLTKVGNPSGKFRPLWHLQNFRISFDALKRFNRVRLASMSDDRW